MRCSHDCMAVGDDIFCFQNIHLSHFTSFYSIPVVNEARLGLRCFSWNSWIENSENSENHVFAHHLDSSDRSVVALLSATPVFLFCRRPVAGACLKYAFIQRREKSAFFRIGEGEYTYRPVRRQKWRVAPLKATAAASHEWKCKKKRRENERKGRKEKEIVVV